jgi:hypothetical protein
MLKKKISKQLLIENYIFCRKSHYSPIIQSPNGKAEVRVLCTWKRRYFSTLLCNLVRLSRGEMIGVKFNKDKDWGWNDWLV